MRPGAMRRSGDSADASCNRKVLFPFESQLRRPDTSRIPSSVGTKEAQVLGLAAGAQLVGTRWRSHVHSQAELSLAATPATIHRLLELLIAIIPALTLALCGDRELVKDAEIRSCLS